MSIALLIGGTGSLGKAMLPILLNNPQLTRIRILSRGEHTQMEMEQSLSAPDRTRVDFFIGDCRDLKRVEEASKGADFVFHLAAMKSVDKAEYDPWEAVQTNIIGTQNVILATKTNHAKKAIFISTDKACSPINIYGATKLVAEKLFIQANIGRHQSRFSVCRYGNVFGSQGSVLKKWKDQIASGERIKITHEEMTRFFLLPSEAAAFVIDRAYEMQGGEVFIPKMKSTTMLNLARALKENLKIEEIDWIGVRPGEKIHEALVAEEEVPLVTDCEKYYVRWPNENLFPVLKRGGAIKKAFTSKNARRFLDHELKELIEWELYALSQKSGVRTPESSPLPKSSSIKWSTPTLTPSNSSSSRTLLSSQAKETSTFGLSST